FDDVPVWLAMRASMSIPGVFEPALIHGRPMADGGLVDPVPESLLSPLGATVSVAVSREGFPGEPTPIRDTPQLLARSVDVTGRPTASAPGKPPPQEPSPPSSRPCAGLGPGG